MLLAPRLWDESLRLLLHQWPSFAESQPQPCLQSPLWPWACIGDTYDQGREGKNMSVPVEKAELIFTKERCLVSSFPTTRHCPSSMNPPLWEIDTQSCLPGGGIWVRWHSLHPDPAFTSSIACTIIQRATYFSLLFLCTRMSVCSLWYPKHLNSGTQ